MRFAFFVHRAAPNPGGSETYVHNMAVELVNRGHEVDVWTNTNNPVRSLNGVNIRSWRHDIFPADSTYDLQLVHGAECDMQDTIHSYATPHVNRLWMLIKPPRSPEYFLKALERHKFISYSTLQDIKFLRQQDVMTKSRRIRHGIPESSILKKEENQPEIPKNFVSVGGYYPHKRMLNLALAFKDLPEKNLETYGYHVQDQSSFKDIMKRAPNVRVHFEEKSNSQIIGLINKADGYIMNSSEEGFGLVLLEAMANKTPWFARKGVGAVPDLEKYGVVYEDEKELISILKDYKRDEYKIEKAYNYFLQNHLIKHTVDDILDVAREAKR